MKRKVTTFTKTNKISKKRLKIKLNANDQRIVSLNSIKNLLEKIKCEKCNRNYKYIADSQVGKI